MELKIVQPKTNTIDLYGREYEFGVKDCFEALRDYLQTQKIHIPPRALFEDDWWEKDLDYFTDEIISEWSHKPVPLSDLKINDVLIFNVLNNIGNHCGVYIGNECFYHHAVNRLSCRESLFPTWHKYLVKAYRYDA